MRTKRQHRKISNLLSGSGNSEGGSLNIDYVGNFSCILHTCKGNFVAADCGVAFLCKIDVCSVFIHYQGTNLGRSNNDGLLACNCGAVGKLADGSEVCSNIGGGHLEHGVFFNEFTGIAVVDGDHTYAV